MGRHARSEHDEPTVVMVRPRFSPAAGASGDLRASVDRQFRRWLVVLAAVIAGCVLVGLVMDESPRSASSSSGGAASSSSDDSPSVDMSDPRVVRYLVGVDDFVATARWQAHAEGWVVAGYQACEWYAEGYDFTAVVLGINTHYLDDLGSPRPSGIAISQDASTVAREAMLTLC